MASITYRVHFESGNRITVHSAMAAQVYAHNGARVTARTEASR